MLPIKRNVEGIFQFSNLLPRKVINKNQFEFMVIYVKKNNLFFPFYYRLKGSFLIGLFTTIINIFK